MADGEIPVNAGDYVVELSLSESDEESYYLSEFFYFRYLPSYLKTPK